MSKLRRSIAILASAMALCTGALVLTTHAADQAGPPAGAQSAPAPSASSAATSAATANPAAAKPPVAKPPAPGAPQVPEESATIRDDPTIAPDPKQSADNSVSFPNDI
jgi:hypothetical protein